MSRRGPCDHHSSELLFCLLRSSCCQVKRLTPRQCLQDDNLPSECQQVFHAFNLCRWELDYPSDVIRFLGPSTPPDEVGFVQFPRGHPERLVSFLDRRFGISD
ncbi:unnamed protein product [Dicrocoelium dendriticum]|nr:unnamed protein product [Dicrocoelium dendriticum]